MKEYEQEVLKDSWVTIKHTNIHIIGVPERARNRKNIWIMAQNSPNLMKKLVFTFKQFNKLQVKIKEFQT